MKWVPDRTGRFYRRPHYEPDELNQACETLIAKFLLDRGNRVEYPISTDDLTVLLESRVSDLDLYSDLSNEGRDVEGVTDFVRGRRPRVRISRILSTDRRMENRFRTTLTHELGHVEFHTFMFEAERPPSLFAPSEAETNKCKRDSIIGAPVADWMEWQAGFACGAFLVPSDALERVVLEAIGSRKPIPVDSDEGRHLFELVALRFSTSRDAARVRLLQQQILTDGQRPNLLF